MVDDTMNNKIKGVATTDVVATKAPGNPASFLPT